MRKCYLTLPLLAFSACSPTMDMQGEDPKEYYAEHPIKNTIETRVQTVTLQYDPGEQRLSADERERLSDSLHKISMLAIQSIQVSFAGTDTAANEERKKHLTKLLRNMGYSKGQYIYEPSSLLKSDEVKLVIIYAIVKPPEHCPDWRTSPITTHSNTTQGNYGCATQVNLGLMIADPHDLVRGTDEEYSIDTVTAVKATQDFHATGGPAASGASGGSTSSSSSSAAPSPASPTGQ